MKIAFVLPKSKFIPDEDAFSGWFTETALPDDKKRIDYYTKAKFTPVSEQELRSTNVNFCLFDRQISNDLAEFVQSTGKYRWTCNRQIDYTNEFLPWVTNVANSLAIRFGNSYVPVNSSMKTGIDMTSRRGYIPVLTEYIGVTALSSSTIALVTNANVARYRTAQNNVFITSSYTQNTSIFGLYQRYNYVLYCKSFRDRESYEFSLTKDSLRVIPVYKNDYDFTRETLKLSENENIYEDSVCTFNRDWLNEQGNDEKSHIAILNNGFFADIYLEGELFNAIDFTVPPGASNNTLVSGTAVYTGSGDPRIKLGSIFLSGDNS